MARGLGGRGFSSGFEVGAKIGNAVNQWRAGNAYDEGAKESTQEIDAPATDEQLVNAASEANDISHQDAETFGLTPEERDKYAPAIATTARKTQYGLGASPKAYRDTQFSKDEKNTAGLTAKRNWYAARGMDAEAQGITKTLRDEASDAASASAATEAAKLNALRMRQAEQALGVGDRAAKAEESTQEVFRQHKSVQSNIDALENGWVNAKTPDDKMQSVQELIKLYNTKVPDGRTVGLDANSGMLVMTSADGKAAAVPFTPEVAAKMFAAARAKTTEHFESQQAALSPENYVSIEGIRGKRAALAQQDELKRLGIEENSAIQRRHDETKVALSRERAADRAAMAEAARGSKQFALVGTGADGQPVFAIQGSMGLYTAGAPGKDGAPTPTLYNGKVSKISPERNPPPTELAGKFFDAMNAINAEFGGELSAKQIAQRDDKIRNLRSTWTEATGYEPPGMSPADVAKRAADLLKSGKAAPTKGTRPELAQLMDYHAGVAADAKRRGLATRKDDEAERARFLKAMPKRTEDAAEPAPAPVVRTYTPQGLGGFTMPPPPETFDTRTYVPRKAKNP